MEIALHRNMEDILHGYEGLISADAAERQKTEGKILFEGFDELMRKYEEASIHERSEQCDEKYAQLGKMGLPALSPEQIDIFLQATIGYEPHNPYGWDTYGWDTGLFITRLIQNSYDAGNNKFKVRTKGTGLLDHFGRYLEGTKRRPIEVIIDGDVGSGCGADARYSRFAISGNAGFGCGGEAKHSAFCVSGNAESLCGEVAEKSTFSISGNTGNWCGRNAKGSTFSVGGNAEYGCGSDARNSTFNIGGNTGDCCGQIASSSIFIINRNVGTHCGDAAKESDFTIVGDAGEMCGSNARSSTFSVGGNAGKNYGYCAEKSIFKTKSRETLEMLKAREMRLWNAGLYSGNRIFYIYPDGREELVWNQ